MTELPREFIELEKVWALSDLSARNARHLIVGIVHGLMESRGRVAHKGHQGLPATRSKYEFDVLSNTCDDDDVFSVDGSVLFGWRCGKDRC